MTRDERHNGLYADYATNACGKCAVFKFNILFLFIYISSSLANVSKTYHDTCEIRVACTSNSAPHYISHDTPILTQNRVTLS